MITQLEVSTNSRRHMCISTQSKSRDSGVAGLDTLWSPLSALARPHCAALGLSARWRLEHPLTTEVWIRTAHRVESELAGKP